MFEIASSSFVNSKHTSNNIYEETGKNDCCRFNLRRCLLINQF